MICRGVIVEYLQVRKLIVQRDSVHRSMNDNEQDLTVSSKNHSCGLWKL